MRKKKRGAFLSKVGMKQHLKKEMIFFSFSLRSFSQTFFGQLGRSHNEKVLSHFYSKIIIRKSFDQYSLV